VPRRRIGARFLWLAVLLAATPSVLTACDAGGGDSSVTSTAPARLLPPEGLSGIAKGFSVVLTWSAPSDSAKVVGYEVMRNGDLIESLGPGETTLTDFDVRPGRSYSYEVRSLGVVQASEPATADVEIRVPPLSAARLAGDFDVETRLVEKSGYSKFEPFSFGWRFRPKCDEGACNVVWRDVGDRHVHAVLKHNRRDYVGDYEGVFIIACEGSRSTSSVHVSLEVGKARPVGGEWRVTSFSGRLSNSEAPQFGCVSSHAILSVKGRLRPPG
jgi:hypothetical protein